jgi:hypothetical protein
VRSSARVSSAFKAALVKLLFFHHATQKDGFFSRPLFLHVPIFGLDKPNFRLHKK